MQYLMFGLLAAVAYCVFLLMHLGRGDYESSYLLYIGNTLFGAVILIYNLTLINKPYVKDRTVSMTMIGHLATLAGTIISVLMVVIAGLVIYPGATLDNAPANTQGDRPAGWMMMVGMNAFLINFAVGSFLSIMTSYAGKKNQTKDKPAHLGTEVSNGPVTND